MPSPLAHAMVGVATAWVGDIAGGRAPGSPSSRLDIGGLHGVAIACGLLAAAPDLDFLVHAHRMYTHSVGATLIVCVATAMWCAARGLPLVSTTVLCGLAYGSHIPLDWLASSELRSPGVMAVAVVSGLLQGLRLVWSAGVAALATGPVHLEERGLHGA